METSDVIIRGFNSQKNLSTKTVQFQISDANNSERFNFQNILVGGKQTHTEHVKLTPTTTKKMNELKKYFRILARKLMVDTKQVCCGETTANFTITDFTPNAMLHF